MCDGTAEEDGNTSPTETYRGWGCRDQIGRGTKQQLYPIYEWNNCKNALGCEAGSADDIDIAIYAPEGGTDYTSTHIQSGRDYVSDTQMPGYSAYQYPHPLRGRANNRVTGAARPTGAARIQ